MTIQFYQSKEVYKVSNASIGTTKKGYKLYQLELNGSISASKLIPTRGAKLKGELYLKYAESGYNLDFLKDKYIQTDLYSNEYGVEFGHIHSYDVINDFKMLLDHCEGKAFATTIPMYKVLQALGRPIESDGSIKLKTRYQDFRIYQFKKTDLCFDLKPSDNFLNLANAEAVFERFYKNDELPKYSRDGQKSYCMISYENAGIARYDNHCKVSNKMHTSGDYSFWKAHVLLKFGDRIPAEQPDLLANPYTDQEFANQHTETVFPF